jgi:aspartate-semialdehyde dehydrogenase
MDPRVPLVVPEVNAAHLALMERWDEGPGAIVANPNCSTIGLALVLAPLVRAFGVEAAHVVTLQALSGAGRPGVASLDALDNVVPYIPGEEDKLATEPGKIFGRLMTEPSPRQSPSRFASEAVERHPLVVSAQCNRVAVRDGHTLCVSVRLGRDVGREELLSAWREFRGDELVRRLPSAPEQPVLYDDAPSAPQPLLHRDVGRGMTAVVGRLQPCAVLGWRFVALSHNTLRGAAGGALLCAELAVARGWHPRVQGATALAVPGHASR